MNNDNNDDFDLFKEQMKGVTPIKSDNKFRDKPVKKKIRITPQAEVFTMVDRFSDAIFSDAGPDEGCPSQLSFTRSGLQHSVIKKLKQGKFPIEASLDLHGSTVKEAREILLEFLSECEQSAYHCVIIVHGKGFRSKQKPVIKLMINRWLREVPQILAFTSAQPKDGGTGAVYVLFKSSSC